jgi:hypothetical protein
MLRKDLYSSLFFLILSMYVCWQGLTLGFGSAHKPGSGFFPFLAGLSLGVLGIKLFLSEVSKRDSSDAVRERIPWRGLGITVGALVGFAYFITTLGFSLSVFFFVALVLRAVGKKNWPLSFGVAAVFTLATYAFFGLLLQSQLPGGPLGFFGF